MTVKQRVKNILLASPTARKYPKELLITYMQKSGMNLSEHQKEVFRGMDDLWTVRRHAQKLVETGEVKLEDEDSEYRYKRFQEETEKHSKLTAEELLARRGLRIAD